MSIKDFEQQSTLAAVQVAVRIRPLSDKDRSQPRFAHATDDDVIQAHGNTVVISPPHNKTFTFDHVFGPQTQQAEIFNTIGQKCIHKFVEGYNVTMLAYGQTSSGKTYTVGTAHHTGRHDPTQEGIVPRAMALLFDLLHQNERPISPATSLSASSSADGKARLRPVSRISYASFSNTNNTNSSKYRYSVKVSFVEIYNEELIDLLNDAPRNARPPITIREDTKGQIYWTGVKEMTATTTDDVLMYLQQGTQNRAVGATDMNEQSSRSHAIFSVSLRQEKWSPSASTNTSTPRTASPTSPRVKPRPLSAMNLRMNDAPSNDDGEWIITSSKLHFVDLAGSERLKRTAAEGDRRKEGININGGLLALGNVISALGDASKRSTHIPYRDSKLTRLLQDSLGGSAMTLMIACVSPMEYNISETLNTLQYANRARNIKNRMEKNEVEEWLTTDNLDLLRATITKLKNELRQRSTGSQQQQQTHRESGLALSPIQRQSTGDSDQDHQRLVADLRRQLEESVNQATVTRERNMMVENELHRLQSVQQQNGSNIDFEHSVEPVIEEYEKVIAKLESQLSLTRAALNHSDFRIDELQEVTKKQDCLVTELKDQLMQLQAQQQQSQVYIEELEKKLMHTVNDAEHDEELLNELKNRIMKFKELDENTECYILDLEKQIAEYNTRLQQHQVTIEQQKDRIIQLESELAAAQSVQPLNNDTDTEQPDLTGMEDYTKERESLHQQIARLEQDIASLQTQLGQQQSLAEIKGTATVKHVDIRKTTVDDGQQQVSPFDMHANHEARKRMFSSGNRLTSNKSALLQTTLASLEHVQSEYVALKERYKHWTIPNSTTVNDDQHPQRIISTMSTRSASTSTSSTSTISSSASTHTGTIVVSNDKTDMTGKETADLRRKCDNVIQQYKNQLQRIDGAIQRVAKLEQTTMASTVVSIPVESPTSPSSASFPTPIEGKEQKVELVELERQLSARQLSLQEACTQFQKDVDSYLDKMQQLSSQIIATESTSDVVSASADQKILLEQITQRLADAMQEVEAHRSKTYVLQTKLQKIEVAFHTQQQRRSSASEDQDGIEQLMKKMDALKIQLETRDVKSITVKEG